jgi:SAM-dependent methyltransferase
MSHLRELRRLSFGTVAELYEVVRPSYPDRLVDDVMALVGAGSALEIGAGTGKATRLFAARGTPVHALEPDPSMAEVARRVCAGFTGVTIEEADFERYDAGTKRFDLLFSATAWHWTAPETRYAKARALLRDGGVLAPFWNRPQWERSPLRAELAEAYAHAAPDFTAASGAGPMHPAVAEPFGAEFERELSTAPSFRGTELRVYDWPRTYSTADYLKVIQTHSDHMVRPEVERQALLQAIGEVIDRHGGSLVVPYVTVLGVAVAA